MRRAHPPRARGHGQAQHHCVLAPARPTHSHKVVVIHPQADHQGRLIERKGVLERPVRLIAHFREGNAAPLAQVAIHANPRLPQGVEYQGVIGPYRRREPETHRGCKRNQPPHSPSVPDLATTPAPRFRGANVTGSLPAQMLTALTVAVLSVVLGTGIGMLRGGADRFTGPAQTFALVAVLAVVCALLLPEALGAVGLWAFLVFGLGFLAPGLLERFTEGGHSHHPERPFGVGLELGYAGLLLHKLGDGVVLGTYSRALDVGHGHAEVLLAVGAHTVPVTALFVLAYRRRTSATEALLRAAGLMLAACVGVGAAGAVPIALIDRWEPWLSAAVGGLLLHVVVHGFQEEMPASEASRFWDVIAVGLGVGLVLLPDGGHHHGGGEDASARVGHAFVDLLLETAPLLLFGLAVGAALQVFGSKIPAHWLNAGGKWSQALRGAIIGAPLPVCACGVLPIADSLRARGGAAAVVVAFLLSTPELGVETFALTVRFLGWPFAFARLAAALAVAIIAALVVAAVVERNRSDAPAANDSCCGDGPLAPARDAGLFVRFLHHFDELLFHVGPWTLVGLLAAAYMEAAIPHGALSALADSGFDVVVVMLIAAPSYVCASSATPFAAVLLAKGLSPGAVLAGLLLGPATNIATVGWLRGAFGTRAALLGLLALVLSAASLGYALNASGLPIDPLLSGAEAHDHGLTATLCVVLLSLLVIRGIFRTGLRSWLATLGETAAGHNHAH